MPEQWAVWCSHVIFTRFAFDIATKKRPMLIAVFARSLQLKILKETAKWQNQRNECAPSEDSDQPGHPPSLIRVFAVHMKKAWVLSYPLSAQRRLWSDWADAQADLRLWSDLTDAQADLSLPGRTLILLVLSCRGSNRFFFYPEISAPGDSDSEDELDFSQRRRTCINDSQLRMLTQSFQSDPRPSRQTIERLSRKVGLRPRVVRTWFQNRRAKDKHAICGIENIQEGKP